MNLSNNRIVKNTIFLYLRSILILTISLYSTRVLLHTLGVDDFGLYNLVAGFVSMFGFLNLAMVNSVQRYMNYALGKGDVTYFDQVFKTSLFIQVLLSLIIFILLETIGVWFINYGMQVPKARILAANVVFQFSTLSFLVKILQVPFTSVIVSYEKMDFFAIQGIVESVLLLFVIYILSIIPADNLISYSALITVVSIFIFFLNFLYSRKIYSMMHVKFAYDRAILKEMFSFSIWNLFGSLSGVLKSQGINILFNAFFSLVVNAARGVSYQVLSGVTALICNFQTAIKPQLIQSYAEGDTHRYFSLVFSGSKITFYLMWIIVLPLILCVDNILMVWLGEGSVPEYTAKFTIIILLTGLVDSYATTLSLAMYAIGNIKTYQIVVSLIIMSILPISYIFLKMGSGPAAPLYISLFISIIAQFVRVAVWRNLIHFRVSDYVKQVISPTIVVSLVTYLISRFLVDLMSFNNNYVTIIITVLITLFINLILIYLFGLNTEERKTTIKVFVNFLRR